ncbi:uncharacterized protein LOC112042877 [Bicyclus anynana]|uniref:Uncharacterized protein LOC112042877 n=1 Tax=Bicyclus anynana TaxID=110368 RepID=A0ABM3LNV9_BICAN|nr:uncharacterized protein LOC112042877 [Bicyclus anynana]
MPCVFQVSSSLGNPADHALALRQKREVDFIGNAQSLIRELVQNLQNAARDAIDATKKFNDGLQEQGKLFSEKIVNDIKSLREQVNKAVKRVTDRFTGAGTGVLTCVDSFRKEVDVVFADTVEKSKACAEERIKEIREMVDDLRLLSLNATEFASQAVAELNNCRENSTGFLATGSCFASVAVRIEYQGAVFLTQSGLLISRINLAIATLAASLEVCAGMRLVTAGITSAKYVAQIGTCSASSVYSSLAGNNVLTSKMRSFLFLTIVLVIWAQNAAQSIQSENEIDFDENHDLVDLKEASEDYTDLRDLKDIKDKIKKGILVAWEVFKVAAQNANTKIKRWVEQEKERIEKLNKIVIERLNKLKDEFESAVTKITVSGDKIRDCLKENRNNIKTVFSTIATNMKTCLSNNLKKLSDIENNHVLLDIDDSAFLANVHTKISTTCKENNDNCLNDIQNEIITEIENEAQNISNKHIEARNSIDGHLDNTIICFTQNLAEAAKTIVDEAVKIVECVKNKG